MADYIDRETLLKAFDGDYVSTPESIINTAPSIDAVEVVRCKDCKHRHEDFCYKLSIIDDKQNSYYLVVNDNDYCKWGEKE